MDDWISVIVPVYNVAPYLPRCLDSILAQTYPYIQIIAVDDGSSDSSGAILDHYCRNHSNFLVIHQENKGVTSARLRGVAEASGTWVGFVDSDDAIEPDMYQRLLTNARTHGAQISHCGYRMVFPEGRVSFFHNTGTLAVHSQSEALQELLSGEQIEPGLCCKLFQRHLFQGLQMDTGIAVNEDLLMNYYLFRSGDTSVFEDWCPYHYMIRRDSVSRGAINAQRIYDPIRVRQIIRQTIPSDIAEDAHRAYLNTCIQTCHTLILARQDSGPDFNRVRGLLAQERHRFSLLRQKQALMARGIMWFPKLYSPLYRIYARYFQNSPYF